MKWIKKERERSKELEERGRLNKNNNKEIIAVAISKINE